MVLADDEAGRAAAHTGAVAAAAHRVHLGVRLSEEYGGGGFVGLLVGQRHQWRANRGGDEDCGVWFNG